MNAVNPTTKYNGVAIFTPPNMQEKLYIRRKFMITRRRMRRISLPLLLLLAYIAVGFVSGIISGDMDLVMWIGEHKLLLAIIVTWIVVRFTKK